MFNVCFVERLADEYTCWRQNAAGEYFHQLGTIVWDNKECCFVAHQGSIYHDELKDIAIMIELCKKSSNPLHEYSELVGKHLDWLNRSDLGLE